LYQRLISVARPVFPLNYLLPGGEPISVNQRENRVLPMYLIIFSPSQIFNQKPPPSVIKIAQQWAFFLLIELTGVLSKLK